MGTELDRLVAAGFRRAGCWVIENSALRLVLVAPVSQVQNVVYAFAVNGVLSYIGKTTQGLSVRMQGYRSPATSAERGGSTNIKNNTNIVSALGNGAKVDIYILDQTPAYHHGEFPLNVAAGIEDSLIRVLAPAWNGRGTSPSPRSGTSFAARTRPSVAGDLRVDVPVTGTPSAAELFDFCRAHQGIAFMTTARGSAFSVEVVGAILEITPASSGRPRSVPMSNVSAVLTRLAQSGSKRNVDYKDLTFHSSYVLAMAHAWRSSDDAARETTNRRAQD